ncbi:MAG: hypothetical protein FWG79_09355 [Bacteroidales bacterium]|nr:hypothetical protein [Bacteroidales bacterium]
MKKIIFLLTLIFATFVLNAQTRSGSVSDIRRNQSNQTNQNTQNTQNTNKPKGFQKENLRLGGTFGLAFGTITAIDISPLVGYQFTPMFQGGASVIYNYYSDARWSPRFTMSTYGAAPYLQFRPIIGSFRNVFFHAEYGILNHDINRSPLLPEVREWLHYPMIGGGAFLPIGPNGGLTISLLWNLNETNKSLYANPILRIGFSFGI